MTKRLTDEVTVYILHIRGIHAGVDGPDGEPATFNHRASSFAVEVYDEDGVAIQTISMETIRGGLLIKPVPRPKE